MAGEINLGNVVGLIKSETAPTKTYVIWAKVLNPLQPDIVQLHYYNADTLSWEPLFAEAHVTVTYAALLAKIAAEELIPGQRYLISDKGTANSLGLVVIATTTTALERDAVNISRLPLPSVDRWETNTQGGAYIVDDRVAYIDTVYRNKTGVNTDNGPSFDAANWEAELTTSNTYYETVNLIAEYDAVADDFWSLKNPITGNETRLLTQTGTVITYGLIPSYDMRGALLIETDLSGSQYTIGVATIENLYTERAYISGLQIFGGGVLMDAKLINTTILDTVIKSGANVTNVRIMGMAFQLQTSEFSDQSVTEMLFLVNVDATGLVVKNLTTLLNNMDLSGGVLNDVTIQNGAAVKNVYMRGGSMSGWNINNSALEKVLVENGIITALTLTAACVAVDLIARNGASIGINASGATISRIHADNQSVMSGITLSAGGVLRNISLNNKAQLIDLAIGAGTLENVHVEGDTVLDFTGAVVDAAFLSGLSNSSIGGGKSDAEFIVDLDTYLVAGVLTLPVWANFAGVLILTGAGAAFSVDEIINLPTGWDVKITAENGKTVTLTNVAIGVAAVNEIVLSPAANLDIVGRTNGADFVVLRKESFNRQVYQSKL